MTGRTGVDRAEGTVWTVAEALQRGADRLRTAGVEGGRGDARLLLQEAAGLDAAALLAHPERILEPQEAAAFWAMVERRARREPLQYILGRAWFYGRSFLVNPSVLIPRPETEMLIDEAIGVLGRGARCLADLGTGSGALAVTLALECSGVVQAVDISPEALAVAGENARHHGVAERVRLHQGDLWDPLAAAGLSGGLEAVVANPPYVAEAELASLAPEVREHEPRLALVAGEGGLAVLRRIVEGAPAFLVPGGLLLLEVGAGQGEAVAGMCRQHGAFAAVDVLADLAGWGRVVRARRA